MKQHASGAFDVKAAPLASDFKADSNLGRMSLDKQYHGDLEATAKGEMLYAGGPAKGFGRDTWRSSRSAAPSRGAAAASSSSTAAR